MTAEMWITAGLIVLAIEQIAWCIVYVSGAWRDTPLGWVWLFKGGCLAVVWAALLLDQVVNVPDVAWVLLLLALIAATGVWLRVTILARFGRFAPYL